MLRVRGGHYMSKTAAIEFLKEQLVASENERKKIQSLIARLPQIDAEIQATKLLLSKHMGGQHQLPLAPQPTNRLDPISDGSSIAQLIVRALTEAGKPQRSEPLLAFLASHGKHPKSATLRSTIHQYVKKGKVFKSVKPGLYGLLEWEGRN